MSSRRLAVIGMSITVAFFLWLFFHTSSSSVSVPAARVVRGDLEIFVKVNGRLEAARTTSISPNLPGDKGKIVWIIEDGVLVQPGDLLVRFDATHFEEEVRQLQANLETQQSVSRSYAQAASWEESQAEREIRSLEFEAQVAAMDHEQLKNGDGPLEIAQRREELNEARRTFHEANGYAEDLALLVEKGLVEGVELLQAREERDAAALQLEVAEQKFNSYEKVVFPSKLKRSQANLERSRLALDEMKKAAGFRIGQARAKAEEARQLEAQYGKQLEKAARLLAETSITAPQQGLVVLVEKPFGGELRKPRVGDVAWQGQPILHLPDLSEMIVATQVREIDLHRVKPAQKVQVSVDAFPDLRLAGFIAHIGILAQRQLERKNMEKVFSLLITLEEHDPRLRPGMNVRAEIISDRKENTLLVPLSAIFGKGNESWCYVQENEKWQRRQVKVGLSGNLQAEILEGLAEGQMVALIDPVSM